MQDGGGKARGIEGRKGEGNEKAGNIVPIVISKSRRLWA